MLRHEAEADVLFRGGEISADGRRPDRRITRSTYCAYPWSLLIPLAWTWNQVMICQLRIVSIQCRAMDWDQDRNQNTGRWWICAPLSTERSCNQEPFSSEAITARRHRHLLGLQCPPETFRMHDQTGLALLVHNPSDRSHNGEPVMPAQSIGPRPGQGASSKCRSCTRRLCQLIIHR
jgi:hypothetical protein